MQEAIHTTKTETTNLNINCEVPLIYAYYIIRAYLWRNWNKPKNERLVVVNKLIDCDPKYEYKTTFKDLKTDIHLPSKYLPSEYDHERTKDFFVSYYLNLHYYNAIKHRKHTYFFKILEEITKYLTYIRHKDKDALTPEVSTEYKENEWNKHVVQVEEALNDKTASNEDLERIHPDNIYPVGDQLQAFIKRIYYIPQSSNRAIISWDKINNERYINIIKQYDQLPKYAQQLIDAIQYIEQLQDQTKKMNQLKRSLLTNLLTYHLSQQKQVNRSTSPKVGKFETNEDVWADAILAEFDFTNPKHIFGLIETYFDLFEKHKYNVDNPIYEVLQHFNIHTKNIKLSDKHRQILDTYMYRSSDRKKVAQLLNIDTDKMRKMTERTISKNIANYIKNVVK